MCHPLSCVSSFAWGCARQRAEELHSVPGNRVRLPEEHSLEKSQEVRSACQPHMHAIPSSAHRGGHRSVSLCRQTVEDRLPLERVPLACTFGSPLDLHVRQSLRLQGPVDLDHHRVELLIAHQQWFPMIVHDLAVHPGVMWLVQSEPEPRDFLGVYLFSVSFCPCLPGPLGLDKLPPTSPPCLLTAQGHPGPSGHAKRRGHRSCRRRSIGVFGSHR